jgi:hypothetical protein
MLDDDEGQAGVGRDMIEEMLDGFQAPRGRTDTNDEMGRQYGVHVFRIRNGGV